MGKSKKNAPETKFQIIDNKPFLLSQCYINDLNSSPKRMLVVFEEDYLKLKKQNDEIIYLAKKIIETI